MKKSLDWRLEPITNRQKEYINELQEHSEFSLPEFKGKTMGEASDYIEKYSKIAHESNWGIEHGY